jgi:ferrochelatase
MKRTEEARQWAAMNTEIVWAKSFHEEPLLIKAFAERLAPLLRQSRGLRKVLFTAHSLPVKAVANGDSYDGEARATATAAAQRVGLHDWGLAYQSQGMTRDEWLGPTVEACLDRYALEGVKEVVVDPIGFVCDHVEVLYDIDILFKGYAAERGIALTQPESLNRFYACTGRGSNQVSGLRLGQGSVVEKTPRSAAGPLAGLWISAENLRAGRGCPARVRGPAPQNRASRG